MLENIILEDVLVFDIETVPQRENLADFSPEMNSLWDEKVGRFRDEGVDEQEYYFSKAGIHAEFGKVVCISAGFFKTINGQLTLRVKSFFGDDEKQVLSGFGGMLDGYFKNPNKYFLCGHNIKEFDVPYLALSLIHI